MAGWAAPFCLLEANLPTGLWGAGLGVLGFTPAGSASVLYGISFSEEGKKKFVECLFVSCLFLFVCFGFGLLVLFFPALLMATIHHAF